VNVYEELGLKRVINASGKMTALGASVIDAGVADYMVRASMDYVNIEALMEKAGEVISKYTGAQDACVTAGAAAGIAIAVAACIAKDDIDAIERLPVSKGLRNEIIIQKGHSIDFGAPVVQMIRLGGGVPVEVGHTNKADPLHIERAVNEKTAALIYVKSHHTVQKGMVSVEKMVNIAKKYDLPLIVDAAAEGDLKKYLAAGADLVIYSGGKAIEGPTSGFIAGRRDLIGYCRLQYRGIGRAMKVGKENIAGLLKAVELYGSRDNREEALRQKEEMEWLKVEVDKIDGLEAEVVQDEAGREIYRVYIRVDSGFLGVDAKHIIDELERGDPAVYTRNHYANVGIIGIDPRPLKEGEERVILNRLRSIVEDIKRRNT
jgi:L-seryl-tRNA(Ser) seleniumtransferase/D-glucosaminate-6-phosphate ammonia-lyase